MESFDSDDIKAFLAESCESIDQVENDIINLEKNSRNPEILVRIYRYLHTLKGNCGFLAFSKLEALAHAGEGLLGKVRDSDVAVNREIADALFQTIDAIRQILNTINTTEKEGDRDYSELIEQLRTLAKNNEIKTKASPSSLLPQFFLNSPSADTIRVDVNLLDRMMNLVGELVLTRNQVLEFVNRFEASGFEDKVFTDISRKLNLISSELQEGIMKTRMQPINIIWQKLPRLVRDLANSCGKSVKLEIVGAETELDRSIIEVIKDPIIHIIRNCIDHGIETPEVRKAVGKPLEGKLSLRAFHEGGKVNIEISDDGCGIAAESIKQKAIEMGLLTAVDGESLSEAAALNLIFLQGLSTSKQVTNLSGRGVGMNIVQTNVEQLNGTVQVDSQIGKGTIFKIQIPLTLAIIPALIVYQFHGDIKECFTIPLSIIQELVRLEGEAATSRIETLYNVPIFRLRGNILPLVYLNRVLGKEVGVGEVIYIVVIRVEEYYFGLVVDGVEDAQDIVVKPLGKQLRDINLFSGATILGDGKLALIINAIALANLGGVTPQIQQNLANRETPSASDLTNELQMVLLFEGVANALMGIPLQQTIRLEEIAYEAIEMIGNQQVLRYRDQIIALINLNVIFSHSSINQINSEKIQVVIVTLNQYDYGLIVEGIIDIVETPLNILGTPTRPGIKYLAVIENKITEIIDIEQVLNIANPFLQEVN